MTILQLANALQFLAVAALWSIVIFYLWPMTRLDGFRQDMFALRDEMFDYAADRNISHDHPAYVILRSQMNAVIRYGHQITFFRFVMTSLSQKACRVKGNKGGRYQNWLKALDTIRDESVRRRIVSFEDQMSRMVMRRMIFGSPVLLLSAVTLATYIMCVGAAKTLSQAMTDASRQLTGRIKPQLLEDAIAADVPIMPASIAVGT